MNKQLYRSNQNKVLGGVCGGIGEYFDIDPTIVRIIWFLSIFTGIGIIAYLVCWLIIPLKSYSSYSSYSDDSTPAQGSSFDKERSTRILGISLILIGIVFMMDKFFRWFDLDIMIPLIIILIGAFILLRARRD